MEMTNVPINYIGDWRKHYNTLWLGPLFLTWLNFNSKINKQLHQLRIWHEIFFSKRQLKV